MEHTTPQEKMKNMKDRILAEIREDKLQMRPKAYFVMQIGALVLVSLVILALSVSIFNFISFSLRLNGHDSLLWHGYRGLSFFVMLFPWTLFFLDVILIVLLEWLIRKFRFGSQVPVLYLLGAIFAATLFFALLIDRGTRFNDTFLRSADQHHMPAPFDRYFSGARRLPPPGQGMCRCLITEITDESLIANDTHPQHRVQITIIPPPDDSDVALIEVGDIVFVAGERTGNTIEAFDIRRSTDRWKSQEMNTSISP